MRKGNDVMTASTRSILVSMLGIGLAFTVSACAKTPVLAVVAAPAPAVPPPAVQAPQPAPVAVAPPPPAPAPAPAPVAPVAPPAPVTARPAPVEFAPNDALRPVHFEFDKSDIRPADAPILEGSAKWLMQNPAHLVLIEGHADPRGTSEYNMALGERRARAAQNFLVSRGIAANRIQIVSYGEERPLCHEENEACWARDRRGMFLTKPQ
jgi:peptidoglycan-associated lipoprotein